MTPSRLQAWIIQAMFSGASSNAPRWSVVGLTGNPTPSSRGSSSRPPPAPMIASVVVSKKARYAVGSSSGDVVGLGRTCRRRRTKAGTTADANVSSDEDRERDPSAADGIGRARPANRNVRRADATSAPCLGARLRDDEGVTDRIGALRPAARGRTAAPSRR